MKKNIGSTDKIVRIVLTIAIGYFAYSTEFETGWIPFILLLIAGIMLVTTIIGFCPLYSLFGKNSCDEPCNT
jgi:uncharacterized SAM-binding protein YcdF (DUF218 family)